MLYLYGVETSAYLLVTMEANKILKLRLVHCCEINNAFVATAAESATVVWGHGVPVFVARMGNQNL